MQPRRILIFSLMYSPFWGGAELAVKEITDRIAPEDMQFDMVTLRADANLPATEKIGNITVHRIGPARHGMTHEALKRFPWYLIKVLFPVLAAFKAKELSKKNTYTVFWSLMTYMGFPAVLARMLGVRVPYVLTLQDGDTVEHITGRARIKLVGPILKKIFRDAARVQVISRYLGEFAKRAGYRGEPVLIPNGVDIDRFTNVDRGEVEKIKMALRKKENELFLITTSRLVEKNGIADVVDALRDIPGVRFLVLGDGHLRAELEQRAREKNVSDKAVFLGHIAPDKIPAYLHASDIFIRASLSEGLGSSFLEAMCAGLPVIATPVGGIPDFLFDIEEYGEKATGVFCEPHNPESVAFAVKRLVQDVGMRQRISKNAREMVLSSYDWDKIARKMRELFSEV